MAPFLNGLLFGLIFIFSVGPGFFSLIQTSVQKGFNKAILLAIGISLSDTTFVILSLMGVTTWLEKSELKMLMALIGAVVLISYGFYSWFKKPRLYENKIDLKQDLSYLKYVLKGYLLNGFNPFILIFWVGIIGVVSVKFEYNHQQEIYFFMGILVTIFSMDLVKAFIANRIRSSITPRLILIMNRSVGVILILFGLQLFFYLVKEIGIL